MFVDKATITVKAGDGGNGCCSFHREKFVPCGGPDGGDGGAGGNVILEATNSEQSLVSLIYNRHYQARNGEQGKGSNMHGRKAQDIILKVPVGTVITDRTTGELIADMEENGKQVTVAVGGRGGSNHYRQCGASGGGGHTRTLHRPCVCFQRSRIVGKMVQN